jgi:chemotaxis response regulator CheB
MADAGVRVALLAKAGESRNQLRTALQDLGADLVCEGDPSELSLGAVSDLDPKVMVVSLEPSIEAALDKFDSLLSSSNVEVVYDDAEVSGKLEGWDLNRWARHLAAKIIGTDLMPPVPNGSAMASQDEWQPQPGAPETPAEAMADAKLEDYLHDTQSLATDVPVNESYSDALQRDVPEPQPETAHETDASIDVNLDDLEQAMRLDSHGEEHRELPEAKVELENRAPVVDELALDEFDGFISAEAAANAAAQIGNDFIMPEAAEEFLVEDFTAPAAAAEESAMSIHEDDFISFDNSQAEIKDEISLGDDADFDIDLSALESGENNVTVSDGSSLDFEETVSTLADFEVSEQPVVFSKYQSDDAVEMSSSMDDDVAALAAQLDEFEKNDNREVARNMDFGNLEEKAPEARAPAKDSDRSGGSTATQITKEMPKFDASSLTLLDMDAEIPLPGAAQPASTSALLKRNKFVLEAIEGEAPAEKPLSDIGSVLILAGMGGPDAVRQLLKALPSTLNVPVLLYQHLEVGKHDRLVAQLEKVSNLPVYLAMQGRTAEPGQVAVIPVGIGLDLVENELFFGGAESQQALVESLPAQHSVVIVLSGAAVETAGAAARVQSQGGLALAQDPANCFEPAAAEALLQQGGKTAEIPALADMVLEYFKR